ncbi:hypothetical protein OZD61_00155 [Wolbachia endosymbiont of Drosophila bocki]|nr:hypothetical protein [Wolbachia endosymbiont of Drosophila bocki]
MSFPSFLSYYEDFKQVLKKNTNSQLRKSLNFFCFLQSFLLCSFADFCV